MPQIGVLRNRARNEDSSIAFMGQAPQEVREAEQKGKELSKVVAPYNMETWPDLQERALEHQPQSSIDPVRPGRRPVGQRSGAMVSGPGDQGWGRTSGVH